MKTLGGGGDKKRGEAIHPENDGLENIDSADDFARFSDEELPEPVPSVRNMAEDKDTPVASEEPPLQEHPPTADNEDEPLDLKLVIDVGENLPCTDGVDVAGKSPEKGRCEGTKDAGKGGSTNINWKKRMMVGW